MKPINVNEANPSAIPSDETKPTRMSNADPGIVPVGMDSLLEQMVANGDIAIEPIWIPITFSNYRVEYIAPNQPDQTFEPRCAILADDSEFNGSTVRVFDVPDPDEGQRAVAQFACNAMNTHIALVSAATRLLTASGLTGNIGEITAAREQMRTALALVESGQ